MLWSRSLNRLDPWREVDQLQREVNRLFNQAEFHTGRTFPAVNIFTNKDEALVTAELPGLKQDEIKLSMENGQLTLQGERKSPELKEGQQVHRRERRMGQFKRTIELPFAVEADKISAGLKHGILSVKLPRKENEKPRTISIQSN
jgi:HSP20 family protein